MDGEGFSKEFIEKYDSRIAEKGSIIKDYSYKGDFVNILLNDVPGSKQIYCDGTATGARNHFSNSMFELVETSDGWHVVYNKVPQESGMTYLHDFSCYLANNMSKEDRYETAEFISELLEHFSGNKRNEPFDIEEYLLSHPDSTSKIFAYLAAYIKENKLTDKQIESLVRAFGIENEKIIGLNVKDFTKLVRYLAEHLEGTTSIAELLDYDLNHPIASGIIIRHPIIYVAAKLFGADDLLEKYTPILEKTCDYYEDNIKNHKNDNKEKNVGAGVTAVSTVVDYARNTVVGTIGINNITVTPEQLKMQADQMDTLRLSYDELSKETVSIIETADKSMSKNMQNSMNIKINAMKNILNSVSELLESGARAASTAAINYESVDKELAKQISNT